MSHTPVTLLHSKNSFNLKYYKANEFLECYILTTLKRDFASKITGRRKDKDTGLGWHPLSLKWPPQLHDAFIAQEQAESPAPFGR